MHSMDEKLDRFADTIYKKATHEKEDILKRVQHQKDKMLHEKEMECLGKAYESIQNGIRGIDKEKNEIVSRAIMDGKRRLLRHREEITDEVFGRVKEKIRAYTKTEEYKQRLFDMIKTNLDMVGEGDVAVYIDASDEQYLDELNAQFDNKVKLQEGEEEILGGCIIINHSNNRYLGETLMEKLIDQREAFISHSKLVTANM